MFLVAFRCPLERSGLFLKARYAAWRTETLAQNSAADATWKVFMKNTPKPKGGSKNESKAKAPITQGEYYAWLGENQNMFKLAIPDF
jgi:hypothetical protein